MTTQHATKGEHSAQTKCSLFYVIFISAVAAIGGFLFGFDSGVIHLIQAVLQLVLMLHLYY